MSLFARAAIGLSCSPMTHQSIGGESGATAEKGFKITGVCAPMQEAQMGTGRFAFENGQGAVFSSMSAAFSPIMIDGALVLPDVSVGMIEASAIRRPVMP
jgi:hypothetical protein